MKRRAQSFDCALSIMKPEITPQQGLEAVLRMFPDFEKYWNESLFGGNDYNLHSVFCELTFYVKDRFTAMSEDKRQELFKFVESYTRDEDEPYSNTDEAVCTCFLENLSGEPPLSTEMRTYMGANSRIYFDYWDGGRSLPSES